VVKGAYKPLVRLADDTLEDPENEAERNGDCGCGGHDDEPPQGEGEQLEDERNGFGRGWHRTPIQPLPIFSTKRGGG
jgi:hypothetical protein